MCRIKYAWGFRLHKVFLLCGLISSMIYIFLFYRNRIVQTVLMNYSRIDTIRRHSSPFANSILQADRLDTSVNGSRSSSTRSSTQIDIVYTWVNGSDPKFTSAFESFMYEHFNENRNNVRCKTILFDITIKENRSIHELAAVNPVLQHAKRIFPLALKLNSSTFTAVEFADDIHVSEALKTTFLIDGNNISSIPCFYTTTVSTVAASIQLSNKVLLKGLRDHKDYAGVISMLPKTIQMFVEKSVQWFLEKAVEVALDDAGITLNGVGICNQRFSSGHVTWKIEFSSRRKTRIFYEQKWEKSLKSKIEVYPEKDTAVLDVPDERHVVEMIRKSKLQFGEDFPRLDTACMVCNIKRYLKPDSIRARRFSDYGGLKYSLRALEKHALWIRHVFIVTNGQIPNWLNLANPKVSIVNHKDIFQNESHLPTFASPAIESNLHRIPGLSDKYIYLNDDWFFGKNVSVEDFYTDTEGEKIRLAAGNLKKCDINCLPSMVGNGACDTVCNNDLCEWDGDDCGGEPQEFVPKRITYMSRLFYTNSIYNNYFGYNQRQMPTHGPFIVDKNVMNELQTKFPNEWEMTSSHKIRNHKGMQYAFAYLYYIIESSAIPMLKLFEDMDADDSKLVSKAELQTLGTRINTLPETIVTLERLLIQCSNGSPTYSTNVTDAKQIEELFDKHVPQVTRYMFTHCCDFVAFVKSNLPSTTKYKYTLADDNALKMTSMTNSIERNMKVFKSFRSNPSMFVCINDGMQYWDDNIEAVIRNIQEQFEILFPVPSKFELPVSA